MGSEQIYPSLNDNNERQQSSSTTSSTLSPHALSELEKANRFETNGLWQQSLDIYVNLIQHGLQNQNSIPRLTLEQITARAEAIKVKIEPANMLLNVPACVDFIENGASTLVAVAFLIKEKSNLVLMNLSNQKEIYLKDCHILKRNNSFAVHNQKDGKVYTLRFNLEENPEFLSHITDIFKNCAINFKEQNVDGSTEIYSTDHEVQKFEQQKSITEAESLEDPMTPMVSPSQYGLKTKTTTDKIATGIVKGSEMFNTGLTKVREFSEDKYKDYAENYVKTTVPNEQATEVSDSTKKWISGAKTTAKYTRIGLGWAAGKIGTAVQYAGEKVADHVEKEYVEKKRINSKTGEKDPNSETSLDKAFKLGGASLAAVGNIWNSCENNLTEAMRTGRTETVKMVHHKHGEEAGKATDDAARTATDFTKSYFYFNDIGMKAIAKKTAKTAGKRVVQNQKEKRSQTGLNCEEKRADVVYHN